MSVPLQPKGRGSVLQPTGSSMPGVGSGAASMARAWANNPLTRQLESWTAEMVAERKINKQRERISQATRAGAAYGNRFDQDNKLMPLESLSYTFEGEEYSEGSPEQSAFQNAALQKYGKNLRAQYGLFAKEEAAKNPYNPAALLKVLRKHKDNIWNNSPDFVKNELEPELRHITNTVYGGVLEASLKRDRDNTKASLEQDLKDTRIEAENLIRIGADQPVYDDDGKIVEDRLGILTNRYEKTLSALENANLINSIDADNQRRSFTDRIDASVHKQRIKEKYRTQGLEAAVALSDQPFESRQISDEDREKNRNAMYQYATISLARAAEKQAALRKQRLTSTQKSNEEEIKLNEQEGVSYRDEDLKDMYENGEISADFYFKRTDVDGTFKTKLEKDTTDLLMRQIENSEKSWDETATGYRNAHLMFLDGVIGPGSFEKVKKAYLAKYQELLTRDVIAGLAAAEASLSLTPTEYNQIVQNQIAAGNSDFTSSEKWMNRVKAYRKDWVENVKETEDANRIRNWRLGMTPLTKDQLKRAVDAIPETQFQDSPARVSLRFTNSTGKLHDWTKRTLKEFAATTDPTTEVFATGIAIVQAYRNADQNGKPLASILIQELGQENYRIIDAILNASATNPGMLGNPDEYRGWKAKLTQSDMSSATRQAATASVQPADVDFANKALEKFKELHPGWFDGLTADPVEEKYISQMSALETRTGVDLEDMPSFPPAMIAELEQVYAGQSKVKYTNEDSAWRASFGILMDAGGWMVEMQGGEPVWVTDQPVSQALTARIGSGVTLTNDDYRKHASDQIRNLGYTKKNGRAILASDIRFVKTNKRQNYTQRGPMGVSANVPHTVTPFTVEYKDGDMWVEVPNFNYVADAQEVINPMVKTALLELRDGGTITEPINYFLIALSKAGIGDMESVISDKAETYFQAFREQSHLDLLQDRMNTVLRSFGLEEINYKLDYEDYTDSVVPGDVAARMVWDSWRIMGQTGAELFSALGQSMADAGGKKPKATAKFDMESMQRANPGVLDIEAPADAETILPDGTRVTGDASVFDLKEPDPLDIAVPPNASIVEPDGSVTATSQALPMEPNAKGRNTVDETVSAVDKVFGGGQFLTEIASAESNYGQTKNTFAPKRDDKGMWQVSKVAFDETQKDHARIRKAKAQIKKEFGIDWTQLKHSDVTKPLVGALAARLYLMFIMQGKKIPKTLKGRAEMWKKIYNTSKGEGTVEHYLKANA